MREDVRSRDSWIAGLLIPQMQMGEFEEIVLVDEDRCIKGKEAVNHRRRDSKHNLRCFEADIDIANIIS